MSSTIRGILLDIEGTTSSISFVHDVMFPFVLKHLDDFLANNFEEPAVQSACQQIAADAGYNSLAEWQSAANSTSAAELVGDEVRRLMATDEKSTGLKALQGVIWEGGFNSGELRAHVYPDVIPAIQAWTNAGKQVRIYSSGSVAAQKLFFGHVDRRGDCLSLFGGHYDTTIGGKKVADSYRQIAADWGLPASCILFLSDIAAELTAAQAAGMQVLGSRRPGNAAFPADFQIPCISSFDQVRIDGEALV